MGFWSRLVDGLRKSSSLDRFLEVYGGREAATGRSITAQAALEVPTVLRCVSVLADGVATVPLKILRRDPKTGRREEATDHPLFDLLHTAPNDWQDSLQFRETLVLHMALTGNAFVYVSRVRGAPVELIPIEPGNVVVKQQRDLSLTYRVRAPSGGEERAVPASDIWHLRGPSWNSWHGLETVRLAREAIGLALATEEAHGRLHRNGVKPSGVYTVEGTLTPEQHARITGWLKANFMGSGNAGNPLVLDRAAKWTPIAMSGVDSQHLETRRHQVEEICRALGVMPIMVGFSDKSATYASAEQMFLAHTVHTIRPWHRRFEAAIRRSLMTPEDRASGFYPKFFDTELLRGAAQDRAEYYAKGIASGWLLRNEARGFEDMDEVEGLSEPLVPMNMVTGNPPRADDNPAA